MAYVAFPSNPGLFNPWPLLTGLVAVALVASAPPMWRYRGPGRRAALGTHAVAAVTLLATFLYFVPELRRIFGEPRQLTDAQLIAHSHAWVLLNGVRLAIVLGTAYWGLATLSRFERTPD